MTPRDPPTHYTNARGWSPRLAKIMAACGEIVVIEGVSRDARDVTCIRCLKTRVCIDALTKAATASAQEPAT